MKIGKNASKTLALFKIAYGEHATKKSNVLSGTGSKKFKNMCRVIQRGQLKTQRTNPNVDRVQTLLFLDQSLSVQLIAEKLNMNRERLQQILTEDLGIRKRFPQR